MQNNDDIQIHPPKPWIAAVLGFLGVFLGMLYVVRSGWAAVYFAVAIGLSLFFFANPALAALGIRPLAKYLLLFVCALHCFYCAKHYSSAQGLEYNVPANHFFLMGDNRDKSSDSRVWGFLPADHVVGKVIKIISVR